MDTDYEFSPEHLESQFPDGCTAREEAHAIVALMFEPDVRRDFEDDLLPALHGDVKTAPRTRSGAGRCRRRRITSR